ncbi:copper resistance protein D [Actinomycetospora sp. NBRC 106375]|uniref:cytochrome c oxidase assembly protein n=1 Tax=Actinomycetospora sp. NBRC 106375 TaxID=3032207 RepID=UPI0024A30A8A|nr:cytochrome c oxidase assembly protein [Actinomycetospora sp. NBRC 106375]GLZ49410.1 copper resistance protein D [Actinomycetospora sp. NBRC 106375]
MATTTPPPADVPEPAAPSARPATTGALFASQVAPVLAVAAVVALALSTLSGAATFARLGLPDPGALTVYALPVVRAASQAAAAVTIGFLLFAGFFTPPSSSGSLTADGYRAVRIATWGAGAWSVAALLMIPLSTADAYGRPVGEMLDLRVLATAVPGIEATTAWALTALVALVVLGITRAVLGWGGTVVGCGLALVGLLPLALTGHSAGGSDHDVATNSLLLHVLAAAVWVGGLVAVVTHLVAGGRHPGLAARRFSAVALVCWIVLAISGVLNTLVRVTPGDLVTSTYGVLILVKIAALLVLGAFGLWHRRRALPALDAGDSRALVRFGGLEVLLMAATVGVAVALGRTPPPVVPQPEPTRIEALLGYAIDEPFTAGAVLGAARFDLVFGTLALVLAGLYLAGVRRLRTRGDAWPPGRTTAWLLGCLALLVATSSGIGRYAPTMFSVHMAQHMTLNMLVPILLVLGAPITLVLRALPPAGAGAPPGPREWVLAAVHSPLARFLTQPLVALALFVGSFYVLYFSGLFDVALESHWAHIAMNVHFLLVGLLFFWPIVGVDPSPRQLPYIGRLGLLFVAVPLHAFFGIAVMSSDTVIGSGFYQQLEMPWVDRLADQTAGGGLAWATGEVPMLLVLIALLVQWSRADERAARQGDRRADRDGDRELAEYNAMLRSLAATGRPAAVADEPPAQTGGAAATEGPADLEQRRG